MRNCIFSDTVVLGLKFPECFQEYIENSF